MNRQLLSLRAFVGALLVCFSGALRAQDITFDRTPASALERYGPAGSYGGCVDSLAVDSVEYRPDGVGADNAFVQHYPLARYEFYADGSLYRRIDIRKVQLVGAKGTDSTRVLIDIPSAAYQEFFPNGNIRVLGKLNGLDERGKPKKTGRWREWSAEEKVITDETYP